jgi:PAS domain S-box-containing protein
METHPNTDELFRLLLAQDPEHAIILLDVEGRIIAWQGAAEKVLGYAAQEVLGQPSAVLFTPEDVAKEMPAYELEVARSDRQAEDDRWMLRKDGNRIWVTGILAPLYNADGMLVGFGKVLRNRTDLKSRLQWLERRLESMQHSSKRKDNFISTLAHEVRNPLGAMTHALELLEQVGSQDDDCVFARSTLNRQIDFIRRLIDDLLDVTRIGAGKVELNKRLLPINDVVLAAVETCRPAIDERTHEIELVMSEDPIFVEGDFDRLQQVFVNLIQNAAKFTEYGGKIWVKVSVEGTEAVAKVEDNGIGISPEMMPLIFELFTQAEYDVGKKRQGLGIGLSVVKDLVELHGGSVLVRSDGIGKGSEFTVRLPLKGPDQGRPDRPLTEPT